MEIFIAISKAVVVAVLILSPVLCLYVSYIKFENDSDKEGLKHRKLFGGDLYKKQCNKLNKG